MKSFALLALLTSLFVYGCQQGARTKTFTLDIAIKDTVQQHIKLHSNKYFSDFETPAEVRFFSDGVLVDSVIEADFHMISWYSSHKDTIDLVAHVGELETQALLIRFKYGTPHVYYFRASHDREKFFRLTKTDSFSDRLEVPSIYYKLILSAVPDSIQKPIVFGSIEMESGIYFDKRDSLKKKKVQMKFYFCSQFRSFNYPQ
jgi:hypothetical protein